jgi:molybdenum cofactor cytidylyltransferase
MIVRAMRTARAAPVGEVLVVTGAYADVVTATLHAAFPPADPLAPPLRLCHNPDYATGQASSIQTALRAVDPATAAALFLPVDMPFVTPLLLTHLITAWGQGAPLAAAAVGGVLRGAPAIVDRALWPELIALTGDTGARPLFQRHRQALVLVESSDAELRDIDTPEELAAVTRAIGLARAVE